MRLQESPIAPEALRAVAGALPPAQQSARYPRRMVPDIASTLELRIPHIDAGLLCRCRRIYPLFGTAIPFSLVLSSSSTAAGEQDRYFPHVATPQHPSLELHGQPANKPQPAIPEST